MYGCGISIASMVALVRIGMYAYLQTTYPKF
jgi:hypothetical protein